MEHHPQVPLQWKDSHPLRQERSHRYRNRLLRQLSPQTIERLKLHRIDLPAGMPLERSEHSVTHVHFIESGLASRHHCFRDGSFVETGMFGYESAVGLSACMGMARSVDEVRMQIGGEGYATRIADVCQEFNQGGHFQRVALGCMQKHLLDASLSAGCNARHDLQQRLARWLMTAADRAGATYLNFSQEFIAMAIGVQRTSVAITMGEMKRKELVAYSRGRIGLLNLPGIRALACECYGALDGYLSPDSTLSGLTVA